MASDTAALREAGNEAIRARHLERQRAVARFGIGLSAARPIPR